MPHIITHAKQRIAKHNARSNANRANRAKHTDALLAWPSTLSPAKHPDVLLLNIHMC